MKAYLISIGDELLIGQTVNTNVSFIAEKLTEVQIPVVKTSVISDTADGILAELDLAGKIAELIIITGGLGPTHDDVTMKSILRFFNSEPEMNEIVLGDIKSFFEKRGKELTETNRFQALVPDVAKPIRNFKGTAPGNWIEKDGKVFVTMPGVPYEMKDMFVTTVLPWITEKVGIREHETFTKNLMTTGIAESVLFDRLGNLDELLGASTMAFLPNQYGVKLRITTRGTTQEECHNKMTEIEQKIRMVAGRYIYGINDDKLEHIIGKLLIERDLTLSIAESCTGGLISHRITNVPGSSNFFERSVVSYSNGAKVEFLRVNEDFLHNYGAVSFEVARQMAEGIRAVSMTDIGLSVTGIMGPGGGTVNKPVGLVYIGICDDKVCTAKEFRFGEERILNKERTSQAALDMLRRHLLGIPYDE